MVSVALVKQCPSCGFEDAHWVVWTKTKKEYIWCTRCGYTDETVVDEKKSKFQNVMFFRQEVWGGTGSWTYRCKGALSFETGAASQSGTECSRPIIKK